MRPIGPSTNQAIGSSSAKPSVIPDRGVERGEIDHNFDRELVLDIILGSAINHEPGHVSDCRYEIFSVRLQQQNLRNEVPVGQGAPDRLRRRHRSCDEHGVECAALGHCTR